jgi:murein DD-endopeptidase MepM/ murein hydrolase activator NlpD
MLHRKLFPQLADRRWGSIDLDALARIDFPGSGRARGDNPLNDPEVCREWVERLHERMGVESSFGGYLEDRSHLWRGHYQEASGRFVHLGVDYNVPAGTEVFAPCPMVVHETRADSDQDGGWGGRVISRVPGTDLLVIFAHLEHGPLPTEGTELVTGARVGVVGRVEVNGGWFPHLHVQCVRGELPKDLDGYACASTGLGEQFPDPEDSIR